MPPQTSHLGSTKIKKTDRLGWVIKGNVIRTPYTHRGGERCDRDVTEMMVMMGGIGIVHVIAMRTTPLRVQTTLVGIPVRIPPEIEPFHFQEDLQRNNRGQMRRPPHPIHKKREVRIGKQREWNPDPIQPVWGT